MQSLRVWPPALGHLDQHLVLVVVLVALARFHYDSVRRTDCYVVAMSDIVAAADNYDFPTIFVAKRNSKFEIVQRYL